MVAETDIRGKERLLERKSLYSQLQSQIQSMEESIKDKDGTIDSLSRQLVNAGIKAQINQSTLGIEKETLETKAQQKLLKNRMKDEFSSARSQLMDDMRRAADDVKKSEGGKTPATKEK